MTADEPPMADGAGPTAEGGDDGLPPLREVITRHEIGARRALGQNFLLDLNLTRRIARTAAPLGDVVEIGPGPGGLTRALLSEGARRVIAVEKDPRCLPALAEISARWPGRLTVLEADALALDWAALARELAPDAQIVANLPYNVGTELVVRWLGGGGAQAAVNGWPGWWRGASIMLQREVVDRIVAPPGGKAYGRLAVLCQWRADVRRCFDVAPSAFVPPPKVTSAILRLTPKAEPPHEAPITQLERVTAAAFGQRRKMLRTSLKSLGVDSEALCARAGVSPMARAETIDVGGFCALARALAALEAETKVAR